MTNGELDIAGVEKLLPLTPLQTGILLDAASEGMSGAYLEQLAGRLRGELNVDAFRRAWQCVVDRHAALRSLFPKTLHHKQLQIIVRQPRVPMEVRDWRGLSDEDQSEHWRAFLEADRRAGMHLSQSPLLRVTLFRFSDTEARFVWTFHHLLLDGWSTHLVLRDVLDAYERLATASVPADRLVGSEPANGLQSFLEWISGSESSPIDSSWKESLSDLDASASSLPFHRNDDSASEREYEVALSLTEGETEQLSRFARHNALSPNTLAQAAWTLLLGRSNGSTDVRFGVTVSGRNPELAGVESIVGLLSNTLPQRVRLPRGQAVVPWLKQLQLQQVDLLRHSHVPLTKIHDWSSLARGQRLFDTIFVFQNYPVDDSLWRTRAGLRIDELRIHEQTSHPCTVVVTPGREWRIKFTYDPHRYDAETIRRVGGHYRTLLLGLTQAAGKCLGDLTWLSDQQRQRVIVDWNATKRDYPHGDAIHRLFEAHAARTPDALAIRDGESKLNYAELNARANRLARYLQRLGVHRESRVAVCLSRGLEFITTVLAIVKAGGVYVPLDPKHPVRRRDAILRNSAAEWLITGKRVDTSWRADSVRTLFVEQLFDADSLLPEEIGDLATVVPSNQLAYVMYTSGSTGAAKGISVQHRAVARLVCNTNYVTLGSEDVVAMAANVAFDASTFEIWGPLLAGASITIVDDGELLSPQRFSNQLRRDSVTVMFLTTALFQKIALQKIDVFETLDTLLFGGEVADVEVVRDFYRKGRPRRLVHVYGPTESTTFATWHALQNPPPPGAAIPIGRPLANTRALILDRDGNPQPVGVVGEIYLGGDGLARGYDGNPRLTAENFVPDHLGAQPGERLYRTGDLGCYLSDGEIRFVGRRDRQIKWRGFRIELEEIESAVRSHPGIGQAAVVLIDSDHDSSPLAVFYQCVRELVPPAELREFLCQSLPDYMVPLQYVPLDSLPLTPNGKVDHTRLRQQHRLHQQRRPRLVHSGEPLRSPAEETLAEIWKCVLGLEQVDRESHFFDAGGHSLAAMEVVARARKALKCEVSIRDVFEHPTLGRLADRIAAARSGVTPKRIGKMPNAATQTRFPLSYAQESVWLLDRFAPDRALFNIPLAFRLRGRVNVEALRAGIMQSVQRHAALRTRFLVEEAHPWQQVVGDVELPWQQLDLRHLDEASADAEAGRLVTEQSQHVFEISTAPLLRVCLIHLGNQEHVLSMVLHHLCMDGWSLRVWLDEVSQAYGVGAEGKETAVNDPVQSDSMIAYTDFTLWQRDWLGGGEAMEHLAGYWSERLADLPPILPFRNASDVDRSTASAHQQHVLPKALTKRLRELSRNQQVSMFMTFMSALNVLLSRYTGQRDLIIGTADAGRVRDETRSVLGLFADTLPIRVDLSGRPRFVDVMERVRDSVLGAFDHRDMPFVEMVRRYSTRSSPGNNPLIQVLLTFRPPAPELQLTHLQVESIDVAVETARFDLELDVRDHGDELIVDANYRCHAFSSTTIASLLQHLENVLRAATVNAQQPISEIDLIAETQFAALPAGQSQPPPAFDGGVVQRFESQVMRTADEIAIVAADTRLSYRELNARANKVANGLRRRGVGHETVVALATGRSRHVPVALLAIWKAGGVALLIDPRDPPARIQRMVQTAKTSVVLTADGVMDAFTEEQIDVLNLDRDADAIDRESPRNLTSPVTSDSLAAIVFTSGSTGEPKGVMLTHGNLDHHFRWLQTEMPLQPGDRMLQNYATAFDAMLVEWMSPLLSGACVILGPVAPTFDIDAYVDCLNSERITVIDVVPSLLRRLIEHPRFKQNLQSDGRPKSHPGIRRIVCGGEALDGELLSRLCEYPATAIYNLYGPAEATITSTSWRCDDRQPKSFVPIGRPITGVRAHVLDRTGKPLPAGFTGELYLAGPAIARGYLQQPRLTAEAFVPDPFSPIPGERMYRTGDLARFNDEGVLEFRGREDDQHKIRGFRVETAESETALLLHPRVQQAAVIWDADRGSGNLVAYYVSREPTVPIPTTELRRFLGEQLPAHSIPAAFIHLDSLPLNVNGKIDRNRLPRRSRTEEVSAPVIDEDRWMLSPWHLELRRLWVELLGHENVKPADNFFDLGGHSLLATQVVARLRELIGVDVPVRVLFDSPTIDSLARRIDELLRDGVAPPSLEPTPLEPLSPGQPRSLSYGQQRLWLLHQMAPEHYGYNVPAAFELSGDLNVNALEAALNRLVARHEVLRMRIVSGENGAPDPIIDPAGKIPLQRVDLSELPPERRRREALRRVTEEEQRPFDLAAGPLLRASLLRLGQSEHVLLLAMHHIVCDGWSIGILVRDLAAFYQSEVGTAGDKTSLPELPVQYGDFALWQRRWTEGDHQRYQNQLAYWTRQLADCESLDLPTDRPRPPRSAHRGATEWFHIESSVAEALNQLSREQGVTLFMTLLAAFQTLLHRYTRQTDIVVGTPVAARPRRELEHLIGFFVNTLPIRTDFSSQPTFVELLARVRETALGAYGHQDLPFEKMVEELHPHRDTDRNPFFQVMFALQSSPRTSHALANDLTLTPLQSEVTTTRFDLELDVWETDTALAGELRYDQELFDAETVSRLSDHFQRLLASLAENPHQSVSRARMCGDAERQQLLDWGRGPKLVDQRIPNFQSVAEAFERQVRERPDTIALVSAESEWSYAELNARANRLARVLRSRGVGFETVVGVCLPRSPELIVSLLAITKAGGAYLPLDPEEPQGRRQSMLVDAEARLLVVEGDESNACVPSLSLTASAEEIDRQSPSNLSLGVHPDHLAYVMYTSGSTGKPKAVAVSHRNILRLHVGSTFVRWDTGDVTLQYAPATFDASTFEIWGPLLHGGRLVVPAAGPMSLAELGEMIRRHRVTVQWFTAGLFHQMVRHQLDDLQSVGQLVAGGDVLSPEDVRRFLERFPDSVLVNGYGPTENTTFSCCGRIESADDVSHQVPIGRPLENSFAFVLDADGGPLPIGVAGELYVGGAGLARGYVNDAALTAERFVPSELIGVAGLSGEVAGLSGERLYRTGDRVRWQSDGRLEFLGRIDDQIKIRGFRIEPGEVEHALRQHSDVQDAAVIPIRSAELAEPRLVAFVVMRIGSTATPTSLRAQLDKQLPCVMVPSRIHQLEKLPMTAGGKVDRRRLEAHEAETETPAELSPPLTEMESELVEIWSDLLGLPEVSIHDSFFELGGHSLLAMQLVSRVAERWRVELPLRSVFESQSIAALATHILEQMAVSVPDESLSRLLDEIEETADNDDRGSS